MRPQRRESQGAPPYIVCGNSNSVHDYGHVEYPGAINNCESCHVPPTSDNPSYYGRDPVKRLAMTTHAGADRTAITDDIGQFANGCSLPDLPHDEHRHLAHDAERRCHRWHEDANGQVANQAETCGLCHGPGRTADIREVHNISFYPLNN